jgi:hypothetical protein
MAAGFLKAGGCDTAQTYSAVARTPGPRRMIWLMVQVVPSTEITGSDMVSLGPMLFGKQAAGALPCQVITVLL